MLEGACICDGKRAFATKLQELPSLERSTVQWDVRVGASLDVSVELPQRIRLGPSILDAANALDDVRAKALERTPFKSVRPVSRDIFRGRIQVVRERTARGLRARSPTRYRGCVGRATDRRARYAPRGPLFPGGIAIRQRPSAVWIIAILIRAAGSLDHAVQRDMFDDFRIC